MTSVRKNAQDAGHVRWLELNQKGCNITSAGETARCLLVGSVPEPPEESGSSRVRLSSIALQSEADVIDDDLEAGKRALLTIEATDHLVS